MSTASVDDATPAAGWSPARDSEPVAFTVFEIGTILVAVAYLAVVAVSRSAFSAELLDVAAWLPVVALADLMPVTLYRPIELAMSFPVLLAAAMLFPPPVAFVLGFVGNTDIREFRREIPLVRGLFNRSNVALSVLTASSLFHGIGGNLTAWPAAVGFALLALVADMLVNNSLTLFGAHLLFERPLPEVARRVYGRGHVAQFLLGYVCFGYMAILLAIVYLFAANWGLAVFVIPVVLAHELFVSGADLYRAALALRRKQRALMSLSGRVADERRDERLRIAADLHDEVLPPLFKVHLMGQVIRHDLAAGRLLELDEDLPGLLSAADAANEAIRVLIRDLRRSSLGVHGLRDTLLMLSRDIEREFGAVIQTHLEDVTGNPLAELLAYHIAREAMNNSVKHAPGSLIRLTLLRGEEDFRVVIQDNGPGFDVGSVDSERHFGLQLMRERVELCSGTIVIDSKLGDGTTIAVRFPLAGRDS